MVYQKRDNVYSMRYNKKHQHRIEIKYKNSYYDEIIKPAIEESGLPVATYIKLAIKEKIERDNDIKIDDDI